MIQCKSCEFYLEHPDGSPDLQCDPFSNIKEPECLMKWQLASLTVMAKSHRATLDMYRRLAPLQEKMMRHMEREIDEVDEADSWKYEADSDDDEGDEDDDPFRI